MKTKLFLILVVLLCSATSFATTRYVSAQGAGAYTTLEAAGTAAVTGDTILVGPGTYAPGSLNFVSKRLTWIGAGWDQTILNPSSTWFINSAGANRSSIEGFRINHPSDYGITFTNNADSLTVRRCFFVGGWEAVRAGTGRSMTIEDCIIVINLNNGQPQIRLSDQNYPTVVRGCVFANNTGNTNNNAFTGSATSGTLEVYNCVFLNHRLIFNMSAAAGAVIAVNNMFYDWNASPSFGTYNAGSVFDYNAGPASPAVPGTNVVALPSDPFVNYDESVNLDPAVADLHLHATNGAAFVNTGHPSLLDFTDGSRSDFGVYGGPKPLVNNGVPSWPWAINVTASPNLVGTGTPIDASATVRIGPTY